MEDGDGRNTIRDETGGNATAGDQDSTNQAAEEGEENDGEPEERFSSFTCTSCFCPCSCILHPARHAPTKRAAL